MPPPRGRAGGLRARARPGPLRAALARVGAVGGLLAGALGAGAGCSLTFDAGDYRCEGEDCGRNATKANARCERGDCDEAQAADACLGHVTAREASSAPVEQTIALRKLADGSPVGGVEVRACIVSDLDCTEPLGAATANADGLAQLAVPAAAWSGYLEYRAPGSLPALVHFLPEYTSEAGVLVRGGLGERTYVGPVAPFEMFAQVGTASGAPFQLDPALGFVSGKVVGCDGQPLAGVIVTLDVAAENTAVIYAYEGLPSASLTSTGPAGDFYVGNVPADRFVIVRAHLAEGGRPLGERRAVSRAGALTVVTVGPSP